MARHPHDGQMRNRAVMPHPLANELTDAPSLAPSIDRPGTQRRAAPADGDLPPTTAEPAEQPGASPAARKIAKRSLMLIGLVMLIAVLLAAMLTRQWQLLWIAALLFVPFMLLLLAPVWLAASTKTAQDQAVRRSRRAGGRE